MKFINWERKGNFKETIIAGMLYASVFFINHASVNEESMLILFRMSNYSHLEQRPMKCITSLCSSVKDRHIPILLSILQSTVKECEKTHTENPREKNNYNNPFPLKS